MNWNFQVSFISTAIIIVCLVWFYRKREVNEAYLGLKLVGYYLLGTFNLHINMVIPIGIVICLVFFHPPINARIKRLSALLGLLMMIVGYVFPMV
jgi:magnesium-transporting ATPase (P-type)